MIVFYGKLSEKTIDKVSRYENFNNFKFFLIFSILSILITVLVAIFDFSSFYYFLSLSILMLVINILLLVVPTKTIVVRLPRKITIDNQFITQSIEGLRKEIKPKIKKISMVKSVLDMKEYYCITFKRDMTDFIVCEKSLLINGSTQEFEKLFEGKIVRNKK